MNHSPPLLVKRNKKLIHHGHVRFDPYHYVREKSKEVISHLALENEYCSSRFTPHQALQDQIISELKSHEHLDDVSIPVLDETGSYWYYERHSSTDENNYAIHCRIKNTDHTIPQLPLMERLPTEEIIFNENEETEDHDYFHVEDVDVNPNGTIACTLIDTNGSGEHVLTLVEIESKKKIESFPASEMEWITNDTILYCTIDEKHRPYRVFLHTLNKSHDLVLEEKDERFTVDLSKTRNKKYIIISSHSTTSSKNYAMSTLTLDSKILLLEALIGVESHWDQCTINQREYWVRKTNENAKENKIQLYDSSIKKWIDIVPHHNQQVSSFTLYSYGIVWLEREKNKAELVCYYAPWNIKNGFGNLIPNSIMLHGSDSPSSISISDSLHQDSLLFRISISSLLTPTLTMDIHFNTGERIIRKREHIPHYNPDLYQSRRIWISSYDGLPIPVSVLYKRGITFPCPLLLKGYGSYGVCDDSHFSSTRLPLLDRGVMIAFAHIRGSGECGRWWYEMGKLDQKENTFYDFISVAHYFIKKGITTSRMMAARGGSAGGLLMGAVMNMEPSLFRAVIADVPFVDSLTTMLDPSLPLSIGEQEEWGNPADPYYYHIMKGYSPYDNVKNAIYPHLYVTTGIHDSRVGFWEPTKWVARLRDAHVKNKVFLQCNESGHSGGSSKESQWEDEAKSIVFFITELL